MCLRVFGEDIAAFASVIKIVYREWRRKVEQITGACLSSGKRLHFAQYCPWLGWRAYGRTYGKI